VVRDMTWYSQLKKRCVPVSCSGATFGLRGDGQELKGSKALLRRRPPLKSSQWSIPIVLAGLALRYEIYLFLHGQIWLGVGLFGTGLDGLGNKSIVRPSARKWTLPKACKGGKTCGQTALQKSAGCIPPSRFALPVLSRIVYPRFMDGI
jgi:hypothetical protein